MGPTASPVPKRQLWPWLVVLAVLLFIGFIRIRMLNVPLERDEGEYAYAGQLILRGIPPYQLAYSMKLPGTYYLYAAGMSVFGQTVAGIHATLLVVNLLAIIFVFLLGRRLFGPAAGVAACAAYGLMSVSTAVLGLEAHATQFVVLFAIPGTIVLWQAFQSGKNRAIFFSGLLYGLAFVMKQQAAFFGVFGLLVLVWREMRGPFAPAQAARRISLYALGAVLPLALVLLYLAGAGVLPQFWFWTTSYARTYATATPLGVGLGLLLRYARSYANVYVGFWILAAAGLFLAFWKNPDKQRPLFLTGFLIFSFLGVTPGLYFRQHYFVLVLPALAVTVGMAVALMQSGPFRQMKAVPVLLLAGVLAWGIYVQEFKFFQATPEMLVRMVYSKNPFAEAITAAQYIRENSSPDARVAVLGSEPEIYFYAHRLSATTYIYTYPLMEDQPYAATMQREMIKEIETARPEYLVPVTFHYSWLDRDSSDPELLQWANRYVASNYDCVGVVDYPVNGPQLSVWGDPAHKFWSYSGEGLKVYRRKPDENATISEIYNGTGN